MILPQAIYLLYASSCGLFSSNCLIAKHTQLAFYNYILVHLICNIDKPLERNITVNIEIHNAHIFFVHLIFWLETTVICYLCLQTQIT